MPIKNLVAEDAEGYWLARKDYDNGFYAVRAHKRNPSARADFAMKLLTEMVKVPFDADGEDSTGRQRAKRLVPSEIVELAFGVADAAFDKMEAEDRFLPIPSPEDCEAAYKDAN